LGSFGKQAHIAFGARPAWRGTGVDGGSFGKQAHGNRREIARW
jgi:hypothetical protein